MTRKLIAFSFEPESIGGFAIVCNGVHFGRNGAFSHCIPMTKQAFLEACKDRIKFNELLGIDIREGWQNALKDATDPFTTMGEDCDPAVVADAIAQADINVRGEEEVKKDMEILDADNEKLAKAVEKEVVPAKKATRKSKKKEVKDDEAGKETVADSSEKSGSEADDGVSAE